MRSTLGVLAVGALTVAVYAAAASGAAPLPVPSAADPSLAKIRAACGTFQPYFAAARFARMTSPRQAPDYPAIVAFRDSPAGQPAALLPLATNGDVGAVYGLAYDAGRGALYAAAFSKRSSAFGPGGTGAVYAIDLATGAVGTLATLFGGRDYHDFLRQEDQAAAETVGRTSLGDIELDDGGDTLFVMNLAEGRIYRIRTADGQVLGSFAHGAAGYPWQRNARPFGLGFRDGWLYHGVVNSLEFDDGTLEAVVFRSQPDGSRMEEVVRLDLGYARRLPWSAWNRGPAQFPGGGSFNAFDAQPLLADVEFRVNGDLLLGLRDRVTDMIPGLDRRNPVHPGSGDMVPIRREGDGWRPDTFPEFYRDRTLYDEANYGGLALLPGFDMAVTTARGVAAASDVGALWYWNSNGLPAAAEPLGAFDYRNQANGINGLGDLELLCRRDDNPDPGAVPTATSFAATATAGAGETATVVALTPTVPSDATPENFDVVIRDTCRGENPYAATVCHPPVYRFFSPFGIDTVQIFRDTPADAPVYGAAPLSAVGSAWGLAYRANDGNLLVGAFHKRLMGFGPEGPGAIYRVNVRTGDVATLAVLDAGPDLHGPVGSSDQRGRDIVAKTSLGDIDLDEEQQVLYVVNLYRRRIVRLDAVNGSVVGSFSFGAAGQDWAADARPFGLGLHGDKVYHGVVNSAEASARRDDLFAVVYESEVDGSAMREVARFPLTYDRGTVIVPGVLGQPLQRVPLDWLPWTNGELDVMNRKAQVALYPQPILADIEFAANGDMIVGLRDRFSDMSLGFQIQIGATIVKPGLGIGDVLRLPFNGDTWDPPTDYSAYPVPDSLASRGAMGGLAQVRSLDLTIANRVRLEGMAGQAAFAYSLLGALWYDGAGNTLRHEELCGLRYHRPSLAGSEALRDTAAGRAAWTLPPGDNGRVPLHNEWIPGKGMGDVEVLCGPPPTPTATYTPGPTLTPSATPTVTTTATQTPSRWRVFLPMAVYQRCDDQEVHADVVLVMDTSTSMLRLTGAGRPKLTAALEAAKAFLALMDFAPNPDGGHDQVAIVGFNDTAWIQEPLGAEAGGLARALDALPGRVAQGTRLDMALRRGTEAVAGAGRRPENTAVVVLMTDGLPNRVPTPAPTGSQDDTVVRVADAAKAAGIQLFTIGVGRPDDPDPLGRINADLLRAIASRPDMYYQTPDAEKLRTIYRAIAYTIGCPSAGGG